MYDCRYWIWLSTKFEPGAIKCDKLLQEFDYNPKAIYEAERDAFVKVCGSNLRLLNALCDKNLDETLEILRFCEKHNVGILTQDDEKYPSSILRIDGQPPVIYYKGTIPDFEHRFSVAIVGTRKVSPYGSSAAYTIAHDIAAAGGIIVSGMALGTDTAAHRGALDTKGTTVAFLGCGIDVIYPKENAALMKEIIQNGAVMTDYPPHARPEGRHFPVRNRLISGVSHGVLIVEAAKKSGALITADHAKKQGKLLYAIPGRIGELNSEGSNNLLISGAKTVLNSSDIINDYRLLFNLDAEVDMSGFKGFKPTERSSADLKQPYKTPTYNPFANETGTYSDRNTETPFYDRFIPYPKRKTEQTTEQATSKKQLSSVNYKALDNGDMNGLKASEPKPIIIYNDFEEDDRARSYMSMGTDKSPEIEELNALAGRPIFRYPSEPMPEGGYRITHKVDPKEYERKERERREKLKEEIGDPDIIRPVIPHAPTLEEMKELRDKDTILKYNDEYSSLNATEKEIVYCLEGGRKTIDAMSHLGIPVPKLLSVLTMLEIKQIVNQLPGGYFELKRRH